MTDVKRLVYSFIQFLGDQLHSGSLTADAAESLEVAIQCLESAYGIDNANPAASSGLRVSRPLLTIFTAATQNEGPIFEGAQEPTDDEKREAEKLKNEGNDLMKAEKYAEALDVYTKAIRLDGRNAIFFSNRAAAHSKRNDHAAAIQDCKSAISIDPTYSKAYGRMGLAYASLNRHGEAKECYQKAVNLDPQNDSYLSNLRVAEEKLRETNLGAHAGAAAAAAGMGGGLDLSSLLSNPALMNMATQMMSDPNMQNLMGNLLSNTATNEGGASRFDALLQAGQQLAAQMQATNPTLVDQLRQQMNPDTNPPDANNPDDSQNNQGL